MKAKINAKIRLRFIEAMLIQHRCIHRENIIATFEVSETRASRDFQEYKKINPGVVFSYVHLTNVTYGWFKPTPGLLTMPAGEYLKMISALFDAPDFSSPGAVAPHRTVRSAV